MIPPAALTYVVVGIFGLLVGSFLNVCIWRIPRNESIVSPPSSCPGCGARIRPWDNVPVLSYILLGGRCRSCKARISPRYPLVEALNAALYLMVYYRYGMGVHLPFYLALSSVLIVITFIDIDHQIIPDRFTIGGAIVGLAAGSLILPDPFMRGYYLGWQDSFIGAATGFGLFFAIAVASRGGMGGGDIKMMAMVGSVLGWKGALMTTFFGSFAGSIAGLLIVKFRGGGRKTKVPFGPFLALGAYVTLIFGQELLGWYLDAGR